MLFRSAELSNINQTDVPSSADLRKQVENAKAKSTARFNSFPWKTNSQIPTRYLRTEFVAEKSGMTFLHSELDKERISARGFHKVLRTAWSIADLQQTPRPNKEQIQLAFNLRTAGELD